MICQTTTYALFPAAKTNKQNQTKTLLKKEFGNKRKEISYLMNVCITVRNVNNILQSYVLSAFDYKSESESTLVSTRIRLRFLSILTV